ncbi:hypothetical protein ROZALSC1DRAFT_25368, partial [Rozella allomycis CSF55]
MDPLQLPSMLISKSKINMNLPLRNDEFCEYQPVLSNLEESMDPLQHSSSSASKTTIAKCKNSRGKQTGPQNPRKNKMENYFKSRTAFECGEGSENPELEMRSGERGEPIIYQRNRVDRDIDIDSSSNREEQSKRDKGKIVVNEESEGEETMRFHELKQDDTEGVSKEKGAGKGGDEGGVDVMMGPEFKFNQIETDVEEGVVKEHGGVAERTKSNFNNLMLEDDEGGVDELMEVKKRGVKEQGGVVERDLDIMKFEVDEGGVNVLMSPQFGPNDIEIEKGGVMGKDNEKGGVVVETRLQFKRIGNEAEIKEGGVMGNYDEGGVDVVMGPEFEQIDIEIEEGGVTGKDNETGGVDVKNAIKFNMIGDDMEIEEGGVMGKDKRKGSVMGKDSERGGNVDSNLFFGLPKRNIKRGEGSVRKRKNSYQFIPNHEDESSINSFFSRRKRSRFNFVIDEEQANENEILENVNESRVYQNEMLQNESQFRVNQSQNQSHINPSFSINENINGGEGRVQSSVSGDQGGIQIENNQSQGDEGGVNNEQFFNFKNLITKESILVNIKNMALGKAPGTDGLMAEVYYYGGDAVAEALYELFSQISDLKC